MSSSHEDIQSDIMKELLIALIKRDNTIVYARKLVSMVELRIDNLESAKLELKDQCEIKDLEIKQLKEVIDLYKKNEGEDSELVDKMMDQEEAYIKRIDELEKQLLEHKVPQLPTPPSFNAPILPTYNALKHAYTGDGTLTYAPPSMATDLGYGTKESKAAENLNKHGYTNPQPSDAYLLGIAIDDLSDSDTDYNEVSTKSSAIKPA